MARRIRIEYAGALYHVTSRGDRREDIFVDAEGIVSPYASGDYLMKDIPDEFNVHYLTVSRAIKKAEMHDSRPDPVPLGWCAGQVV
jgi:hypothetical protein